jgi:predicted DNA-binding mobile mystery protein A
MGENLMKSRNQKLIRQQISVTLDRFTPLKSINPPLKGWIRAIRDALGMNVRQFAERLKVDKSRVSRIERDEIKGNLTLKTMRSAAEALDCIFVYSLVPRTSLEDTLRNRAEYFAKQRATRLSQTMLLEDQKLTADEENESINADIEKLINESPKSLWDEIR